MSVKHSEGWTLPVEQFQNTVRKEKLGTELLMRLQPHCINDLPFSKIYVEQNRYAERS